MPLISQIVNCDTRKGWLNDVTGVQDHGDDSLCGCRSIDFMLSGIRAKNKFLASAGCDIETIVCIDLHEPPAPAIDELFAMKKSGDIQRVVMGQHSKKEHRWNDIIYCDSLELAKGDYTVHWDGDCVGYRREGFDVLKMYLSYLDDGYKYVCQQTPLNQGEHCMFWASTRFFICRTAELDIPEVRRCLDDGYRAKKFPGLHLPCVEHILGAMAGDGKVLYPPSHNEDFIVWSWVKYYRGLMDKLNAMPYSEVKKYVKDCGIHGASDVVAKPL